MKRVERGLKALVSGALLATGMAVAIGASQGPESKSVPQTRSVAPTAAAQKQENCGTFWTAPVEDPEADVNPCPKDCVRGERQLLKPSTRNGKTLYEARYQCYRAAPAASVRTELLVINGVRAKSLRTAGLRYRGLRAKQVKTAPLSFSGLAPGHIAVPALTFRGRR